MQKQFLILVAAASLVMANYAQAGLGWTLAECKQHYGRPIKGPFPDGGRNAYFFKIRGYDSIVVAILNGTVSRVAYIKLNGFNGLEDLNILMKANLPETTWSAPVKDISNGGYDWKSEDGEYSAALSPSGDTFILWTKEDNDALETDQREKAKDM
jgi:hypothetical protein